MDKNSLLAEIRDRIRQSRYRLTGHAERESESDRVTRQEIEESLLSAGAEIIEHYPEDVRGKICLVLGFIKGQGPIHVVCGLGGEVLVIVTVYRPDPGQWLNWRIRNKWTMKTCHFCQGKVVKKKIRHVHYWGDEIVIFENVPAEVCTQCGEVYFSPDVLEMMDNATLKKTPPDKSIAVPVFSLS